MNVPNLRFSNFENKYTHYYVKQLTLDHKQGYYSDKEYDSCGVKVIRGMDLKNPRIDYSSMPKYNLNENDYENFKVVPGDFLIARSGGIGSYGIVNDDSERAVFASYIIRFRFKKELVLNEYFGYYFQTRLAEKQLKRISQSSANVNINAENIKLLEINLPSIKEQEKIVNLLESIDKQIANLENKVQFLERKNKEIARRLFNQEIRFNNNTKAWQLKLLSEVCDISKGKQLNRLDMVEDGAFYVKNGGKAISGRTSDFNTKENTISISEGGESCGYISYNYEKFWAGGHLYVVKELKCDTRFLYHSLKYYENEIMRLRVGSGLPNIQKKALMDFKILIPDLEEQVYIANFSDLLEDQLNNQKNMIQIFMNLKKELLRKMFI